MSLKRQIAGSILIIAVAGALAAMETSSAGARCSQPGNAPCSGGEAVDQQRRATNTPFPSATGIAIKPLPPLQGGALTSGVSPDLPQLLQTAGAQTQMTLTPSPTLMPSTTPTEATAAPAPTNRPVATPAVLPTSVLPSAAVVIISVAILALLIVVTAVLLGVLAKRKPPNHS